MVAAVAPATSPAAPPINTANADHSASDTADDANAASSANTFAALMQKQMGKQSAKPENGAGTASRTEAPEGSEVTDIQAVAVDLTALMPFLEAAGLLAKDASAPDASTTDTGEDLSKLSAESLTLPSAGEEILTPAAILPPIMPSGETSSPDEQALPPQASELLPQLGGKNSAQATLPATTAIIAAEGAPTAEIAAPSLPSQTANGIVVLPEQESGQTAFAVQLSAIQKALPGEPPSHTQETANSDTLLLPDSDTQPHINQMPVIGTATDTPTTQRSGTTQVLQIASPVGSTQWSRELGNQVVWMTHRLENRAEMVLNPPQMGRIEVSLSVTGDQANAVFTSANPTVRDALEAAMPRLRETLADAGIQLGQAQVGAENARQFAQQEKNGDNFVPGRDTAFAESASSQSMTGGAEMPISLKAGRSLVDVFA